jgi:hypothetical protein
MLWSVENIAKTERGKQFLDVWDTTLQLYAIYGIGRLVIETPQLIARLSESWKKFKPETKEIPPTEIDENDVLNYETAIKRLNTN